MNTSIIISAFQPAIHTEGYFALLRAVDQEIGIEVIFLTNSKAQSRRNSHVEELAQFADNIRSKFNPGKYLIYFSLNLSTLSFWTPTPSSQKTHCLNSYTR